MEEYSLFLDESKNNSNTIFIIGGFIIKNSEIDKLNEYILNIKKCIWNDDYISNNHPILHCTNINTANSYRANKNKNKVISKFKFLDILCNKTPDEIKEIYNNIYIKLCETVKNLEIIPLGCILNLDKYKFIYDNYLDGQHEMFFEVAMQQIVENFSYFLYRHRGVGNIIYESRNGQTESKNSNNSKMFDNFCKIKICNKGISFISQKTISETVKYMNMFSKYDDVAGLQLADFIAYEFMNRGNDINIDNYPEFTKKIFSKLYNGEFHLEDKDLRYYFGLRKLPFDYDLIVLQQNQIEKLNKSNKNLKNKINKMLKSNELLKESKQKLIDENNKLRQKIVSIEDLTKIGT